MIDGGSLLLFIWLTFILLFYYMHKFSNKNIIFNSFNLLIYIISSLRQTFSMYMKCLSFGVTIHVLNTF